MYQFCSCCHSALRFKEMLHTAHYRDRIRKTIFEDVDSEYASLFKGFEGGSLIMWRWSSLIQVCRAMKLREGPLRMLWSLKRYLSDASAAEDAVGNAVKVKTESLKVFDQSVSDPFFWNYMETWIAFSFFSIL